MKKNHKPLIAITRDLPGNALNRLAKQCELRQNKQDKILSRPELIKLVKGADGILSQLTDRMDEQILEAAGEQLKIVANYAVGFDNIDLMAASSRGVTVTNAPNDEISESVAEHTFALMIALARHVVEADKFTRAEKYHGWSPTMFLGTDLHHKTLGIVGLGRIGHAVAERAALGFKMRVIYHDVKPDKLFEKKFKATKTPLQTLLKTSDFITLHVPLLKSTRHLISAKELALMKNTAYLINTSRGPVVDEKALLKALKNKQIAGAGLDVFECEPAIDCDLTDKLALKNMSNTILTPHIASATIETRAKMASVAVDNLLDVLVRHKPARNAIK